MAFEPIKCAFDEFWPEAEIVNLFDDSLSTDRAKSNGLTTDMAKRITDLGNYAGNIGATGVLFTCSAFGPAIDRVANNLTPSQRGEKEITDINNFFLKKNKLKLSLLDNNTSWIDTGTYSSLIRASKFFEDIEILTGKKMSCIEEIAYEMNYIDDAQLLKIAESMKNSEYGKYLFNLIK